MHVRRWFGSALVVALLASCGGPGGSVEECIGSYSGTYAGDASGTISATLDRDRELEVSLVSSDGDETTADFTVTSSNTLSRDRGRLDLSGTFDEGACAISGDWTLSNESGTYSLEKVE